MAADTLRGVVGDGAVQLLAGEVGDADLTRGSSRRRAIPRSCSWTLDGGIGASVRVRAVTPTHGELVRSSPRRASQWPPRMFLRTAIVETNDEQTSAIHEASATRAAVAARDQVAHECHVSGKYEPDGVEFGGLSEEQNRNRATWSS